MISELLSLLSKEMKVLLTAAMPIIELRGAIPVGVAMGMSPLHTAILAFLGSLIPVPFILFTIRPLFNAMKRSKLLCPFVERLTARTLNKSSHKVQKYGAWALIPFVAIPLPGTGVWTGSLAAALLNIRFKWAFPAIVVGNLIAAVAISTLSKGLFNVIGG